VSGREWPARIACSIVVAGPLSITSVDSIPASATAIRAGYQSISANTAPLAASSR
jgi:hypothetical protein